MASMFSDLFSQDLAIDLGTANTLVHVKGQVNKGLLEGVLLSRKQEAARAVATRLQQIEQDAEDFRLLAPTVETASNNAPLSPALCSAHPPSSSPMSPPETSTKRTPIKSSNASAPSPMMEERFSPPPTTPPSHQLRTAA